jgi:predicted SnoaL-like aldol condensation-catalyzing enzyme
MGAIGIWRIRDGQIVEHWYKSDTLCFLQQLGVVPTPEQAGD